MKMNQDLYDLLTKSGRTEWYTYQLLNYNDEYIRDLDNCESFTLDYNAFTSLKSSINLSMHDDPQINLLTDRIKIIMHIKINNTLFDFPLGIYLMCSPDCTRNGNSSEYAYDTRSVQLYSKLKIYEDDKCLEDYVILTGTSIDAEILRLLGTNKVNIPKTGRVMTQDKVFSIGTKYLEIINYLLGILNFTTLDVDGDGYFYANEYILPTEKEIDIYFTDDENQCIEESFEESFDTFDVPNVFIGYCNDVDGSMINYTYVNSNPESPTSTVNMHRSICTDATQFDNCESLMDLQAKVKRWASENTTRYRKVQFNSMIIPVWSYMDCIALKNKKYNGKSTRTAIRIDSRNRTMTHSGREAIAI